MTGLVPTRVRRVTVGLAVSQDFVRGVAVKGDRILWATAIQRDGEPLQVTIERVLAASPLPRWPRTRVTAAVGPSSAQTKRLARLPALPESGAMDELVRESASRFFLRNGVPLVTAVSRSTDGEVWGTAFDRTTLDAIAKACDLRRVRLQAVAPSVVLLSHVLEDGHIRWTDGDTTAQIDVRDGRLSSVHRGDSRSHGERDVVSITSAPLLASLGEDGWRFADALGAATAPHDVLAWRPRSRDTRALPRWRLVLASLATVAASIAWLIAPGVAAANAQHDAQRRLTALAEVRRSVFLAERELARVTRALADVRAFDTGAIPATMLLADLTRAMPEGAVIVALRIAGGRGTLASLAPRSATVLGAIERVDGIEGAEIVGPVTREMVGTRMVERLSIRFRFRSESRRGRGTR